MIQINEMYPKIYGSLVKQMTRAISFIHAADLHLDSPFKGLKDVPPSLFSEIRESTFQAFDQLVKTAIHQKVDFILLVGDLFDNERQSLKAQIHLRRAFETLKKNDIHVYLSYGNHDYINGNKYPMEYPDNVHIFPNEKITTFHYEKNNEKIASIYGFSYENRAVMTNKTEQYVIENSSIPFHIAMLHGSLYGNKEHDPYAPFQLQQLRDKHFDYWALGHIHKREMLCDNPPILYPGNIQGRHRHETGEKGCYYVKMTEANVDLQFIPLQAIQFEQVEIDITKCQSIQQVEQTIENVIQTKDVSKLIYLTLYSKNEQAIAYENDGLLEQLIEIMNESFIQLHPWCFIYRYDLRFEQEKVPYDNYFMKDIIYSLEKLDLDKALHELYTDKQGRKFLENVSTDKIKMKAKQLLQYELFKE